MGIPYRARVDERWFLNLPGFYGEERVIAYIEDTADRDLGRDPYCDDDCSCCPTNFEPRVILELADRDKQVRLEFGIDSEEGRANALYKLDTLIATLRVFRKGLREEFEHYERRESELEGLDGE